MSIAALAARSSSACVRSWIAATRAWISASGYGWQTWQARLTFSSGLRTQWSETFIAPSRWYGMWQSAQATPERAWIPWLQSSNSGCWAFSTSAPVSACCQS